MMEEVVQETIVVDNRPEVTEESLGYLKSSAGWAQFLAIVSFISCGLVVLGGIMLIVLAFVFPAVTDAMPVPGMPGSFGTAMTGAFIFLAILYLVIGVIGFILAYYLYQFSVDTKKAVLKLDTGFLTSGMGALHRYFKMSGILTIITLVLGFLWIPVAVLIALGAS